MASRCVAQGASLGVEHDDSRRDEFLVAVAGGELLVELLERLGRIAELTQENPEQVLGLKAVIEDSMP